MTNATARTLLQAGLWAATGRLGPSLSDQPPDLAQEPERRALLSLAQLEKMIPMLHAWACRAEVDLGPAPARLTAVFRQISDAHYRALGEVVQPLAESGVKTLLLKGGDLDLTVYPPDLPRSMGDLDLMVRPTDVETVTAALHAAGFRQGGFDHRALRIRPAAEAEKLESLEGGRELLEFGRIVHLPELSDLRDAITFHIGQSEHHRLVVLDRDVYALIAFDVHINLSGDFDLHDSWWNPRSLTLPGGCEMLAQSYSDLLWYLAARLYHEVLLHSGQAMRSFVDVCAVLARFGDQIDWDRVVAMGRKYNLHPSLYFVLWHANEILGSATVPARVLEAFDLRHPNADRSHDWGDFAPKMLGEMVVQPLLARHS